MVQKKILRYERTPYAKQIRKDDVICVSIQSEPMTVPILSQPFRKTIIFWSGMMKGHNTIIPAAIRGRYVGEVR